ncbi:mechanosensitive ion channel protein 10-like [Rosa rugosa]|uniref:mechanosensitive ion channel protein 10-like n=1 Tax=Rosa rugosa TaxID=74645 RepID=UPI002B4006EF|nr:mechanosensitive ion channel protein 10-like [Rosa rugosa]XP_061989174.1 mechanosensitive ion channel protein 10-like [Rosa rugosa]
MSMSEKQSANGGEVTVEVQNVGTNEAKGSPSTKQSKLDLRVSTESSSTGFPKPDPGGCPSPDISRASPNPSKCPSSARNESINRRKSFNRSVISKPKSRFGEPSPVILNEDGSSDHVGSPYRAVSFSRASPNNISKARAISISSNRIASPGRTKDKEDKEIYKKVKLGKDKHGKMTKIILIESIVFLCILGCLVASLTVEKLEHFMVWGLEI